MIIHSINVGHGDMTLINIGEKHIMVDCKVCGTDDENYKYLEDVIPEIDGKRTIDYVIITHPDADHIKGLDIIYDNFEIGEIWESGFRRSENAEESPEYDAFLNVIENVPTRVLKASSTPISIGIEGVEVYCLCSKSNENDDVHYNSLVIKIACGNKSVIFSGDSNCEAWKNKVVKYYTALLETNFLHASHHGSRTFYYEACDEEQDEPFIEGIEAMSPDYTIISGCDEDSKPNEDYPPHEDAIELYQEYTSKEGGVYITGCDGTLVFEITDEELKLDENASKNYTFMKGKKQKYNKLKAPFTGGLTSKTGRMTRDSWG